MSDTILKDVKTLLLHINYDCLPIKDDMMQLVSHDCKLKETSVNNEYTGNWKVEVRKPSEAEVRNKTFYIAVEIMGIFVSDYPVTETKAKELLFPHLTKKLKSLLETAGIRTEFIPESVLNGLVVSSEE